MDAELPQRRLPGTPTAKVLLSVREQLNTLHSEDATLHLPKEPQDNAEFVSLFTRWHDKTTKDKEQEPSREAMQAVLAHNYAAMVQHPQHDATDTDMPDFFQLVSNKSYSEYLTYHATASWWATLPMTPGPGQGVIVPPGPITNDRWHQYHHSLSQHSRTKSLPQATLQALADLWFWMEEDPTAGLQSLQQWTDTNDKTIVQNLLTRLATEPPETLETQNLLVDAQADQE